METQNSSTIFGYDLIAKALKNNNVDIIYGIVGIPVTQLARSAQKENIRFISMRNEQAASFAAGAYGYLNQKPGVCLTVSAPGFINGLSGLANATTNCFPMILISGSSDNSMVDLNQGDYQALDQLNAAKPFAKAAFRIDKVSDIGIGVARAIRAAISGRPGGVYLDIPARVLHQIASEDEIKQSLFTIENAISKLTPNDNSINSAITALKLAQKPLIIMGKGASYAKAENELLKFIDHARIPFLTMPMAKGLISDDHPLCVNAARSLALQNADVIVLIGARLNWLLDNGNPPKFPTNYKLIQIDICAEEMDVSRKVDFPIVGDIKAVMGEIVKHQPSFSVPESWIKTLSDKVTANKNKLSSIPDTMPMNFSCALRVIRDEIANYPEMFYVTEGANTLDFGRSIISMNKPRKRLDTGTWGTMGVGLGYAIAATTTTSFPAIAVEGDAAFGFSGMELETICRYNLPITVVIFNNGGIYKGDAVNEYSTDPDPTRFINHIHYEKMMEAFEGYGYTANTADELSQALKKALSSGKPSLINCFIDPTAGTESGHLSKMN